jgi:hypothetical protein
MTSYKGLFMSSAGLGTKNDCAGDDQQPNKEKDSGIIKRI